VSRLTAGQLLFNWRTLLYPCVRSWRGDTLGIREDLLGRAAKESAFNSLDLYFSVVEIEIVTGLVENIAARSGEDRSVLMQLKHNFI